MSSAFFAAIFLFLCLPTLIGKLLRIEKIFPLVFLQLLFGLFLKESGAIAWLKAHDIDLLGGALSFSLQGLGWLGVVMMIALAGAASMTDTTGKTSWRFVPVSVAGFFSTFALGSLVGYQLALHCPGVVGPQATPLRCALTLGVTLSVTALPVLISILRDTGMAATAVGKLAVNAAMLDDVWLWLGIALILSFGAGQAQSIWVFPLLLLYAAAMFLLLKPALRRWYATRPRDASLNVVLAFVALVCFSAMLTNLIGLHPLFGAFVAGVVFPRRVLQDCREALTSFSHILLLPFYFIVTGMRLDLNVSDPTFWVLTAVVTTTAVAVKFTSVTLAARGSGLPWSDAGTLGCLMQCKGLMELIAINIFFDAGIIAPKIYSALAMMALISTLLTAPAMLLISRWGKPAAAPGLGQPSP